MQNKNIKKNVGNKFRLVTAMHRNGPVTTKSTKKYIKFQF
jgi:hypothetical protein